MNTVDLKHLVDISEPVRLGFERIGLKSWGIEGNRLELVAEIGSLARAVTIFEGYRHGNKSRHQLADELSDVLFVLIKMMREEGITLPDTTPVPPLVAPVSAVLLLARLEGELPLHKKSGECSELILRMVGIVAWLAGHYHFSLYDIHKEEMRSAALWQNVHFDAKGRNHGGFFRRLFWFIADRRHTHRLEKHYLL
jgi:hypothetical protein